ncbi:MAG: phosphoribosylaminoimidazolesuccinocarboxamide synthase [bacterium]|nr:phosphoribosylaminoimidazolesuccinocarboxamide synthase [bacterium]
MERNKLLYEGKAKKMFQTDSPNRLIQHFKDDLTALNGAKKGSFNGKGAINCAISEILFKYLEGHYVPTHYIERANNTDMVVRKLEMFPIEVVLRNIAAGSMVKRFKIKEGEVLQTAVYELYLKDDKLNDPMINESHALAFNLATAEQMRTIAQIAKKVNALLRSFFERRNLLLVDLKLEFGHIDGEVYLGDEISPDTMRIWDKISNIKLDKDRFRLDLGEIDKGYKEILKRISNV